MGFNRLHETSKKDTQSLAWLIGIDMQGDKTYNLCSLHMALSQIWHNKNKMKYKQYRQILEREKKKKCKEAYCNKEKEEVGRIFVV